MLAFEILGNSTDKDHFTETCAAKFKTLSAEAVSGIIPYSDKIISSPDFEGKLAIDRHDHIYFTSEIHSAKEHTTLDFTIYDPNKPHIYLSNVKAEQNRGARIVADLVQKAHQHNFPYIDLYTTGIGRYFWPKIGGLPDETSWSSMCPAIKIHYNDVRSQLPKDRQEVCDKLIQNLRPFRPEDIWIVAELDKDMVIPVQAMDEEIRMNNGRLSLAKYLLLCLPSTAMDIHLHPAEPYRDNDKKKDPRSECVPRLMNYLQSRKIGLEL